ncbi:MAG: lipocalin-like domain-containing protein [Chloroflexota bacterium]|jgi:predicted secreted hydrolase
MGRRAIVPALLLLAIIAAGYLWWRSAGATGDQPRASLIPLLVDENTAGFARATEPNALTFPRDLGPHDDYQTEWWYYTGNLAAEDGRQFGFQLTFFRRALTPPEMAAAMAAESASEWRTNQVYLAHFTISDLQGQAFYPGERFSRGAAGLAGAQAQPYLVWLENWFAQEQPDGRVRLFARSDEVALDLLLTETLPPILHGDGGLSPKGPEPGNASYYYSIIQQRAEGTVSVQGIDYAVTGRAWKDHEYSTSALSPGAVGWDWFSIQLDDGGGLMFFQIRQDDGRLDPASSGTVIFPDGSTRKLAVGDWQLEVLDRWTSPHSGADYPAGWRITIPDLDLELTGRPLLADQELNVSTTYWEGATAFEGQRDGMPITGQGYVELTGYAEEFSGRL